MDNLFQPLWSDIDSGSTFPEKRPFLAHYTSIATLESVVSNDEMWFSNPLNMNDMSELRFGMLSALEAFRAYGNILLDACESQDRFNILATSFERLFHEFDSSHVLDTYVFCLSAHNPENTDGRLSMWRTYGANGNGAAIVIDTSKINALEGRHPIIFSDVKYLSIAERDKWIQDKLSEFAAILKNGRVPTEQLHHAANHLFQRFKMFSLFSKHCGFKEEEEWRVAYLESWDENKTYSHMLGYTNTTRGVQLKFKYKVHPIAGITAEDLSLEKIISQIILGPTNYNFWPVPSLKDT